jgi:hypothetical protein
MAENFSFSVILEPQENGGLTVLVPTLPEVVPRAIPGSSAAIMF